MRTSCYGGWTTATASGIVLTRESLVTATALVPTRLAVTRPSAEIDAMLESKTEYWTDRSPRTRGASVYELSYI